MIKRYCDICGNEIESATDREFSFTLRLDVNSKRPDVKEALKEEGIIKPNILLEDVCYWCAKRLNVFINSENTADKEDAK